MKIRKDFVTNSSSSSFICCFARIADPDKAQSVLSSDKVEVYTAPEALNAIANSRWSRWLEYDWASIDVTPSTEFLNSHIDDRFIVITDSFEIDEPYDEDPNYDICFEDFDADTQQVINEVTEENGFADINCQYGAGRDG